MVVVAGCTVVVVVANGTVVVVAVAGSTVVVVAGGTVVVVAVVGCTEVAEGSIKAVAGATVSDGVLAAVEAIVLVLVTAASVLGTAVVVTTASSSMNPSNWTASLLDTEVPTRTSWPLDARSCRICTSSLALLPLSVGLISNSTSTLAALMLVIVMWLASSCSS